jgi:hypothetical protein
MALLYAARCERYAAQRGWAYDPQRMSIGHLTPRQQRRAMHKERHMLARLGWATWHEELRRYGTG